MGGSRKLLARRHHHPLFPSLHASPYRTSQGRVDLQAPALSGLTARVCHSDYGKSAL